MWKGYLIETVKRREQDISGVMTALKQLKFKLLKMPRDTFFEFTYSKYFKYFLLIGEE